MRLFCQAFILVIGTAALASPHVCRAANPAEPPLPTMEEILPRVIERAQRDHEHDRAFEAQFIFVTSKVTEHRNAKGEVKKQEVKISTNQPAQKLLVATVGDSKTRESERARPVSGRPVKERGKASEKDEFAVNEELFKRFEFTLVGRELTNGRPALVVDFVPAQGELPERNINEKFLSRTAGRVWLDEEDYTIARLALRLTDRVNVVGGLVGAVWEFSFGFERQRTPEGLWFVRETNWHLEGREVFVKRIMDFHEERTDVRRAE